MVVARASTPKKQRTSSSPFASLPPNPHFSTGSPRTPQHGGTRSYPSRMPMTPESPESPLLSFGGGRALPPHMGRGRGRFGRGLQYSASFRNLGEAGAGVEGKVGAAQSSVQGAEPAEEEVEQGGEWVPLQGGESVAGVAGDVEDEGDVFSEGWSRSGSESSSARASGEIQSGQDCACLFPPLLTSPSSTTCSR